MCLLPGGGLSPDCKEERLLDLQQVAIRRAALVVRVLHDEEVTAVGGQREGEARVAVGRGIVGGGEQRVGAVPERERGVER